MDFGWWQEKDKGSPMGNEACQKNIEENTHSLGHPARPEKVLIAPLPPPPFLFRPAGIFATTSCQLLGPISGMQSSKNIFLGPSGLGIFTTFLLLPLPLITIFVVAHALVIAAALTFPSRALMVLF